MKTTSDHAQEILDRSASPALSLRNLIEALEREGLEIKFEVQHARGS